MVKSFKDHKASTDICFLPRDLEDKLWGKSLKVIPIVEKDKIGFVQYYIGLDVVDPFEINFTFNMQRFLPGRRLS